MYSNQPLAEDTMQDFSFGMDMTGWNLELPSYIDELLSGTYNYQF